jgi:hypothetical protein
VRKTGLFKPVWMGNNCPKGSYDGEKNAKRFFGPDCCLDDLEYVEDEKNGGF